jgi:excisionase family DNA binding protein
MGLHRALLGSDPVRAEKTRMQQTETYYTVEQVAIMLSRGKDWVWAQCRDRKIPHHKLGRSYRFTDGDLKALAAQSAVTPGETDYELLTSKGERRIHSRRVPTQ